MKRHSHKHIAYTCLVRPVARVLIWLPLVILLLIVGGPAAILSTVAIFIVFVINLAMTFRKSPMERTTLAKILRDR